MNCKVVSPHAGTPELPLGSMASKKTLSRYVCGITGTLRSIAREIPPKCPQLQLEDDWKRKGRRTRRARRAAAAYIHKYGAKIASICMLIRVHIPIS